MKSDVPRSSPEGQHGAGSCAQDPPPGPESGCHGILNDLGIAFVFFEPDGTLSHASETARRLFGEPIEGATRDYLNRLKWEPCETLEGETSITPHPWSDEALEGPAQDPRVMCLRLPNAPLKALLVHVRHYPDAGEEASKERLAVYFQDVTEQLQLERSNRIYHQLHEASQAITKVGGWEIDLETDEVFWTAETYRLLDTSPQEFTPTLRGGIGLFAPEFRPEITAALHTAMNEGKGYDLESEILTAKGRRFPIRTTCEVFFHRGRPAKLIGAIQDITERKRTEDSLRIKSQLLEASQAIAKVGGWELDLETSQLYWTAETYRIHDTSPEEFNPTVEAGVGYFLPESRQRISDALDAAMTTGEGYDLELDTLTTKGRRIHVRTTCEVTCREGKPIKLTGIFQDITAAKETEAALRHAAQFSQDTLDALDANICVLDGTGTIVAVNRTWLELASEGTRRVVETAVNYLDVCDTAQGEDAVFARESADGIRAVLNREKRVFYYEYPSETPKGRRWFAMRVSRFHMSEKSRIVVAHSDITERWSAQVELRQSQTQLRQLAWRLQQATEQESRRIASVVHDDLGQQLTGLKMDLRAIQRLLDKADPAATAKALRRAAEATKLVDDTVETVQRIASDLRPAILDQLGLWAALREESRLLEKRANLTCSLTLPEAEPALVEDCATACFRIVREALTNIVRHAGASSVDLTVEVRGEEISLSIEDDGRGIDPAKIYDHDAMGLLGIRERARQLGGDALISRRPQGGTTVRVKFPFNSTHPIKEMP